ncbi:hypothetical protein CFC21_048117 [Triticum aestivum]|uniref:BHLH domain-containing protein n=2 Tax=Triticum aestivum TaxID=4565 RepID=A0A9R1FZR3_WHEAT|nr:transcription factor bHLH94-like [Triticum aestivum]KAF7037828.1 hypothetical protein CFC21_048117 [Triticum aestivum]
MALEAVVFPHEHLACSTDKVAAAMSMYAPSLGRGISIVDEFEEKGGVVLQEEVPGATAWAAAFEGNWEENHCRPGPVSPPAAVAPTRPAASGRGKASSSAAARRRRRRPKAVKNREETESQRRNHIAVERNRRRQMNDYLAVLRSAMPPSYAQRGDQASIVAGAINFVKELEQLLQSLEAQKRRRAQLASTPPFAGFFTSPQYSTGAGAGAGTADGSGDAESRRGARRGVADVEVAVAESHASVKVLAPRRPKQLVRMVVAMQCLGLTVLHLNATATADHLVFYSFSLRMEEECRLSSVDEIAAAVHQMVAEVHAGGPC